MYVCAEFLSLIAGLRTSLQTSERLDYFLGAGYADAEIEVPSAKNPQLSKVPCFTKLDLVRMEFSMLCLFEISVF